jgi:hypothetical protein
MSPTDQFHLSPDTETSPQEDRQGGHGALPTAATPFLVISVRQIGLNPALGVGTTCYPGEKSHSPRKFRKRVSTRSAIITHQN